MTLPTDPTPSQTPNPHPEPARSSGGPWSVLQSVLAAAIGVQSEAKRQADFKQGKPGDYILMGIVFVIVFVVGLIVLVRTVLSNAGV